MSAKKSYFWSLSTSCQSLSVFPIPPKFSSCLCQISTDSVWSFMPSQKKTERNIGSAPNNNALINEEINKQKVSPKTDIKTQKLLSESEKAAKIYALLQLANFLLCYFRMRLIVPSHAVRVLHNMLHPSSPIFTDVIPEPSFRNQENSGRGGSMAHVPPTCLRLTATGVEQHEKKFEGYIRMRTTGWGLFCSEPQSFVTEPRPFWSATNASR